MQTKSANARSAGESTSSPKCSCATAFEIRLARPDNYGEFKRVLDVGRHPAFIGRQTFWRNSQNGGALLYVLAGEIVAVSLINPNKGVLLAMNVHPAHRGHGLGSAVLKFLMPNFVRAIEAKVAWFERRGYRRIGDPKQGRSLTTQLLAREALFGLAGRIQAVFRPGSISQACPASPETGADTHREAQTRKARKTKVKPRNRHSQSRLRNQ